MLDKLMGTPPTPPPPDTATDLSQKAGEQPKTVRARLEQHRDKASCRMCHGVIDPTGLALENFDAIGQWRTTDSEAERSDRCQHGAAEWSRDQRCRWNSGRNWPRVRQCSRETVTERLMMYAVNRQLEYFDMPQVRAIVRGGCERQLQVVFDRFGNRQQRRVPQAGCRGHDRV